MENILYDCIKMVILCFVQNNFVHILHWLKGYQYGVKNVLDVLGTALQIFDIFFQNISHVSGIRLMIFHIQNIL